MAETKNCFTFDHQVEAHVHDDGLTYAKQVFRMGDRPGLTGPPCIWDNSPTFRAGACWMCPMCGTSTAC